jgi:hypothetical protein
MTVVAEVHETFVARLREWLRVKPTLQARVTSDAFPLHPKADTAAHAVLTGTLTEKDLGQLVGRNEAFSVDPAARADLRVVKVTVHLDKESSAVAADYVNMDVDVKILKP